MSEQRALKNPEHHQCQQDIRRWSSSETWRRICDWRHFSVVSQELCFAVHIENKFVTKTWQQTRNAKSNRPRNGFAAQRNNLTSNTTACTVLKHVMSTKTQKTQHVGDHHIWWDRLILNTNNSHIQTIYCRSAANVLMHGQNKWNCGFTEHLVTCMLLREDIM